jgi:aryl-alcohol dehydrogenase-like predicted oxidoreductase
METTLGQSGKLFIGTANFGSNYGVANELDGLGSEDLKGIFQILNNNSYIGIDTASSYEKAEEIIGKFMHAKTNKLNSKINSQNYSNPDLMVRSVKKSLLKVQRDKFETIYLHGGEVNNLRYKNSISEGLARISEEKLCDTLGVSCYNKNEVLETVENFKDVRAFQVPENILDQRLVHSNEIMQLSKSGFKFEIRSIFLQGSMLMEANNLPKFLNQYKRYFEKLNFLANKLNVTVFNLALNYAISIPWKTSIVVGVNNLKQFEELIDYNYSDRNFEDLSELKAPEELVDPRKWEFN